MIVKGFGTANHGKNRKTCLCLYERKRINYDRVVTDDWDSVVSAFGEGSHNTGKKHTVGMKGTIAG
jgi:hypothetical protein